MKLLRLLAVVGVSWIVLLGAADVAAHVVIKASKAAHSLPWSTITGIQRPPRD